MSALIIGVDLATAHFELAVTDARFEIQQRKRLSRGRPLDRLRLWALAIQHRRGLNKATIALAN